MADGLKSEAYAFTQKKYAISLSTWAATRRPLGYAWRARMGRMASYQRAASARNFSEA